MALSIVCDTDIAGEGRWPESLFSFRSAQGEICSQNNIRRARLIAVAFRF